MNETRLFDRIAAFAGKRPVRRVLSVLLVLAVFLSSTAAAVSASGFVRLTESPRASDTGTQLSPVRRTAFVSNDKLIRIKAVSMELDIDVSVLDMTGNLVAGVPFEIVVTNSETGEETARTVDDDMDGNVYISDVSEGRYIVSVEPMEDFETPNEVSVEVAPKIVFEKQDVSELIVSASEIDASQDDKQYDSGSSGGGGADASSGVTTVTNTVEFVESSSAQVVKTDANGNPVVSYKLTAGAAVEAADGKNYIKLSDGTRTKYYVETDASGNITAVFYDTQEEAAQANGVAFSGEMLVSFLSQEGTAAEKPAAEAAQTPETTTPETPPAETPPAETPPEPSEGGDGTPNPGGETGNETPPPEAPVVVTRQVRIEIASLFDEQGNRNGSYPDLPIERHVEVTTVFYGWQDNYTRYYDKNGNMVTGVQVIEGKTYIFGSDGLLGGSSSGTKLGIDVSTYQDTIDWARVKAAGVEFVFIRLGFRGYGSGKLVADSMFHANMKGATAAGLKVGVYFYSQAINEQEAVEEASMCLQLLEGYGGLQYPVAIDVEYATSSHTGRADKLTRDERTKVCIAFCETIKNAGYIPAVYANKDFLENRLYSSSISGYIIWLAHYTGSVENKSSYKGRYDIWQYTSVGTVDGIKGSVDMNISYW